MMTLEQMDKLDAECERIRAHYLEKAKRGKLDEMFFYTDLANQVEITRRAMWDYYANGERFTDTSFED